MAGACLGSFHFLWTSKRKERQRYESSIQKGSRTMWRKLAGLNKCADSGTLREIKIIK